MKKTYSSETSNNSPILLREAVLADAGQIASLFQLIYRESSHPCKDAAYIESTFQTGTDAWHVAVAGEKIVGCTASRRHGWNWAYEMCRSVTLPEYRGGGLGTRLYAKALEESCSQRDCDLTVGFPRTYAMYRLISKGIRPGVVLVGHDGAMNVANGLREFHLAGLTSNGHEPLRRVVPYQSAIASSPFVQQEIIEPLGIESEPGEYPADCVVGAGEGEAVEAGAVTFQVQYDSASPSRALEITGLTGANWDAIELRGAFDELLQTYSEARHVSVYVLADKEALIYELTSLGFGISAYFPAWHKSAGKRYDAVLLTRRTCTQEPVMHGTQEVIRKFDRGFAGLSQAIADAVESNLVQFSDQRREVEQMAA